MAETKRVIREDLSEGKSLHKIPVINEIDNEDVEAQFLYIDKNVDDRIISNKNRIGCKCIGECKPSSCECIVKSTIKLYEDGRVRNAASLLGQFYNSLLYECNKETCECGGKCSHKMTPKKFNLKVELFKTVHAGFAVRSRQYIECGTFIAEFVGEILSQKEALVRPKPEDYSYLVLNEISKDGHYVDPTRYGNITRFFNHSCFENLLPLQFFSDHRDKKRASIGFVACRDILPGDELTIDYGTDWWLRNVRSENSFYCQCDSVYCMFPAPEKRQLSADDAKKKAIQIIREKHEAIRKHKCDCST